MRDIKLGPFEESVLLAVLRQRENAYGVAILQDLERRLGRRVTVGATYATLDRLEERGFVNSKMGEPTAERGGRAKKYFVLTALGAHALEAAQQRMRDQWSGVSVPGVKPA